MGSEVRRHLKRKKWKKVHENKNKTKQTEKTKPKKKQNKTHVIKTPWKNDISKQKCHRSFVMLTLFNVFFLWWICLQT